MNVARQKDIDSKAKARLTTPSGKAKEAPTRLSDLVREEAKSSEESVAIQPPPRRKRSKVVRKDAETPARGQSSTALEDGRRERTGSLQKEGSIEHAVIERQPVPERSHLKRLDEPGQLFQRAVDITRGVLQAIKANAPFSMYSAEQVVDLMLPNLQAGDDLLVHVFTAEGHSVDPALEAVNVCILAVNFGLELGYTEKELHHLSLAALLHDIGMTRLPEGLVEKDGPLNPAERASLARHPEEGFQIIRGLGPEYTWLADIIVQAYERVDGSGYPRALKGPEVHEYAQIVGLADIYESLVHHRPYRRRMSPLEAMKEILNRERTAFPDKILKALIQALSPYPVGSIVRLNTGEIGRVIAKDKDRPLRPVIEVLVRGGKHLEEPVVTDLSQSPLLNVQDSLAEEDLS